MKRRFLTGSDLRDFVPDVLIAGGGNAALCAAIAAREGGASVLLLECAPREFRGGNSRHTRNLRFVHETADEIMTGQYLEEEFWDDLKRVTGGKTNEALARLTIRASADLGRWMPRHGVRFQPPLSGTLHLGRTNAFFLGGGKALVNAYYRAAEDLGVAIAYDAEVDDLELQGGHFAFATTRYRGERVEVKARTFVAASGGFEANIPWLRESWGEVADNFIVRGTPYNQGRVLRVLLDKSVAQVGDARQCHAVAVDARAPKFDGGIVTRVDAVPFGIVVNRDGARFYDEGEDFWPKRYAIWGRLIAQQPGQIAYAIIDSKPVGKFMPTVFPPVTAASIGELARALGLHPADLESTVRRYNGSVRAGTFDPASLDGCRTEGLQPPKTHWALPIDRPPFSGYALRPGITFTYLGVAVDERARVLLRGGDRSDNVFAAGEIMAGNVLGQGYLAGFGMTIGSVFGRIAGREAAARAAR
jgi:tricarballylate dehydrogenase